MKTAKYSILIFWFLLALVVNCSNTETKKADQPSFSNNFQIVYTKDSAEIQWDDPQNITDSIDHYELYYHVENKSSWTLLDSTISTSTTPKVTIYRKNLPANDSIFYFAVRNVFKNKTKSELHSSSDSSATPPGWYALWKINN